MRNIFSAVAILCFTFAALPTHADEGPNGWWSFEETGPIVKDRSGNGLDGSAEGCPRSPGRVGQALRLDGAAGMTVPDSPLLHAGKGFAVECWIRPDTGPTPAPMNIVCKADAYMLRVDPEKAGGSISLFVRTEDGSWEPRVRGPRPEPGKWGHILASWDGRSARLCVNEQFAASAKIGKSASSAAPMVVGGPSVGMAGFVGLIDEVRFYGRPIGPAWMARRMWQGTGEQPAQKRTDAHFGFETSAEGWQGEEDANLTVRNGALCAVLHSDTSLVKVIGLDVDAAANPVATIRMAASSGKRGVCVFVTDKTHKEAPFRLIPDGEMHCYTLRCASQENWDGRIWGMGLRVEGAKDTQVRIDFIRLDRVSHAPPDLRILSLSPERRINAPNRPVAVHAWLRNLGGAAENVMTRLVAPPEITIEGGAAKTIGRMEFDEQREIAWTVRSEKPTIGSIRAELSDGGAQCCAQVRPVQFADDPDEAAKELARSRPWRRAGYPRSMDFRHLFPQSVMFLEHNTAFLVDFIDGKIQAAQDLKRRYPDRLVLMQVNDEVNGLWGSWHCVPREFAAKEGLTCDPDIFPMPSFRGYWLLGPGAALATDLPADVETCEFEAPEIKWFIAQQHGREDLRDVLIIRRTQGKPDWAHSEYASVTKVDKERKTITITRWPREAVGAWREFRAGETYVAPSVGSVYRLYEGPVIKTWVPNLTRFCPRDPETGMDAATWWARHFARLWHTRIAASEPHPDGIEFDGLDEGAIGDCNNDGVVDGCEINGISYWRLGIYDFFRTLRNGGDGWTGTDQALILADASSVHSPRCLNLLNGSENEEFPSFSGPDYLPAGLDLYRVWCAEAARPSCSYLQGRFACDTYLEQDWRSLKERGKFHDDSLVRLSIALACMGEGIYTYRAGSRRDIRGTLAYQEMLEYPWDEYHAGREGTYNWLGLPLGEPVRMTDNLGPDLLPSGEDAAAGWELVGTKTGARVAGPKVVSVDDRQMIEVDVVSIDTTGLPRVNPISAAERAVLTSPETQQPLDPQKEYCAEFWISADPQCDEREGSRFAGVWRCVSVCLRADGANDAEQWILVGPQPRPVALTLRTRRSERCCVAFRVGGELGPVRVSGLRLREGCAEVFCRRFEHGLVLANGSALSPYTFDIARLGGGRAYRRFSGAQGPDINTGEPVATHLSVRPQDALLLKAN